MKVMIADDHGIVRSGITLLLERQPDIDVIGEASDGAEALTMAIEHRPDVAVLDISMPKLTGLQAAREIKQQAPEVNVLLLSMHDDESYLYEALRVGAGGYVLKRAADQDLVRAVRAVNDGEPFLTDDAQRSLVKAWMQSDEEPRRDKLTDRELEVVKLIAEAHTNKQIAEVLGLSEKTVESHRSNILNKLGMSDRVELVRYAVRRGLIEA